MIENIEDICSRIRFLLDKAVKKNLAEGILLSGGLDTSILATVGSRHTVLKAFTVVFQEGTARDIEYAKMIAEEYGLEHDICIFGEEELYDALQRVIRVIKSFDPMEVRNSIPVHIGLEAAREKGVRTVMTGDAADELFGGYSFLFSLKKEDLDLRLRNMWDVMSFSSLPLAEDLEMEAFLPFLDPEFKDFAMKIDPKYKIRKSKGKICGKWILRKAYEKSLPEKIAWREKVPIELGSGTAVLPKFFDERMSEEEFNEKRMRYLDEDKVTLRNKEHLTYYEVYRSVIGVPYSTTIDSKRCPYCNSNVPDKSTFCKTCGAYPI
jgi:asparagine synthase (glutamine-hydrolysing)